MTLAAVKEKLHEYIEHGDKKKVQAMYTLIENDIEEPSRFFDKEMMSELNERRKNYLSGKSKTYTLEESMENIRKHRAARKK